MYSAKWCPPVVEGSLEVKLPTIWTDEKQSREEAERKRKIRRKKSRRERVRRKKMEMREKVGKSRNTVFFPMIWGSGGSKSRLAKAAGAETAGQMRDEKLHAVVARSTFASQNVQNTSAPDHFWKLRCRKKCTPLWPRSTFPSQNVQNTPLSDHFWKLRCRKSARRCGAKHISKSKCTKHTRSGPLLAVEMSKKCTPLWREAHFQVKMYKTPHVRATLGGSDVEKVHAVVARSTFRSQNVQKTRGSDHFWRFRCRFASLRVITLHYTLHYTTVHYTTLHSTTLQLQLQNYTTTLHYTPLHYINYNTLRHITLHSTTLHDITLHYTLHHTTLHYTTLHYTIHSTHYSTLHYTTLHNTTTTTTELHNYTPLHSTTHRYTKLHYTTLHYTRKIDR